MAWTLTPASSASGGGEKAASGTETETTEEQELSESGKFEGEEYTDNSDRVPDTDDATETFPREYVEKLRDENAKYRQRAQQSDELAHRLHTTMVEATGRLADPTDLPYDDGHLEDSEALHRAIDALLESKPHLAARKPVGSIGQGATTEAAGVDLVGLLRKGA